MCSNFTHLISMGTLLNIKKKNSVCEGVSTYHNQFVLDPETTQEQYKGEKVTFVYNSTRNWVCSDSFLSVPSGQRSYEIYGRCAFLFMADGDCSRYQLHHLKSCGNTGVLRTPNTHFNEDICSLDCFQCLFSGEALRPGHCVQKGLIGDCLFYRFPAFFLKSIC